MTLRREHSYRQSSSLRFSTWWLWWQPLQWLALYGCTRGCEFILRRMDATRDWGFQAPAYYPRGLATSPRGSPPKLTTYALRACICSGIMLLHPSDMRAVRRLRLLTCAYRVHTTLCMPQTAYICVSMYMYRLISMYNVSKVNTSAHTRYI